MIQKERKAEKKKKKNLWPVATTRTVCCKVKLNTVFDSAGRQLTLRFSSSDQPLTYNIFSKLYPISLSVLLEREHMSESNQSIRKQHILQLYTGSL